MLIDSNLNKQNFELQFKRKKKLLYKLIRLRFDCIKYSIKKIN